MNPRYLHPLNVTSGALVLGGVLIFVVPGEVISTIQLVVVTAAAATGLHVLAASVPSSGWISPFKWMSPFDPALHRRSRVRGSDEIASISSKLSGRRQRIGGGLAMPPETLRLLDPLIRGALDLNPEDDPALHHGAGSLSQLTRTILNSDPLRDPPWYRTSRSNPQEVADDVLYVLDELDRITTGIEVRRHPIEPHGTNRKHAT